MKSNQSSPAWPYLVVLAVLFALTVTAPRAWEGIAKQQTVNEVLSSRPQATERETLTHHLATEPASEHIADTRRDSIVEQPPAKPIVPPVDPQQVIEPVIAKPAPPFADQVSVSTEGTESASETESTSEPRVARRPDNRVAQPDMKPLDTTPPAPAIAATPTRPAQMPTVLLAQLDALCADTQAAPWAAQVKGLLEELFDRAKIRPANEIMANLESLSSTAETLSGTLDDREMASRLWRAELGLERRLEIWRQISGFGETSSDMAQVQLGVAQNDVKRIEQIEAHLGEVLALTSKSPQGPAWNQFLLLQELRDLTAAKAQADQTTERELAREILDRVLQAQHASPRQSQFVGIKPIAALGNELKGWASEPVAAADLLAHLERYEQSGLASDAEIVAADARNLAWSGDAEAKTLARRMETNYRNANLRLAVTGALLNRFLPQPAETESPVRDRIAGASVQGYQKTLTNLSLKLVPDARHLRFGLEAAGRVDSDTAATSGPATFYSNGESSFLVRKLFVLGDRGLHVWPAVAEADSYYNNLNGLETDYDAVPLLGLVVRNIARSQHDKAGGKARMEVEHKVASKARTMLDEQLAPRVTKATENFRAKVLAPLERLSLDATPIELNTTAERMTMRVRLAGQDQLGAHTPRPRAMSDSVVSVQVHQSALNNMVERFDLEGREFELPELFDWMAKKMSRPASPTPEDLPDNVKLKFADHDAVRVRCENNRMEVTIALAELRQSHKVWRNFTARALYRPDSTTLQARLVREGTVFLEGEELKGKAEFVLRAIFSKVLSHNRPIDLLPGSLVNDPRVQDLEINQFVIEDGWIGLAYGPRHGASNVAGRNNAKRR